MKKIMILTIDHVWCDTRLYYKIVKSLQKKDVEIVHINKHLKIHDYAKVTANSVRHPVGNAFIRSDKINKLFILKKLYHEAILYNPDIIICIEPLTLLLGYFIKKRLKCRFVYDCHEFFAEAFKDKMKESIITYPFATILSKLYRLYEKFFASKTDAIITVNQHLVDKLKKANPNVVLCANYLNKNAFKNCTNGETTSVRSGDLRSPSFSETAFVQKDGDRRSPLRTDGVSPFIYTITYLGSLAFERGIKIYLNTAKLFKDNNTSYTFLIIGNFKNKETEVFFFDYIKKHSLENHIIYKPYTINALALKEIQSASIGIFMGDGDQCPKYHKTLHMKIFEYLSQSIPVIVNKLNMLEDFVNKSQAGWVINYDCKELYELVISIINDEDLIREKGRLGYQYTIENCIWENQEIDLYNAVLGIVPTASRR